MKSTEIFPCLFYTCPNCGENDTVRSQSEIIHANFRCRHCKIEHVLEDLIEKNDGKINTENLDFGYAEFMCDCGETNVIPMKRNTQSAGIPLEDGTIIKLDKVYLIPPKTAICNSCWEMYNLQLVVPESYEKHLRNS